MTGKLADSGCRWNPEFTEWLSRQYSMKPSIVLGLSKKQAMDGAELAHEAWCESKRLTIIREKG